MLVHLRKLKLCKVVHVICFSGQKFSSAQFVDQIRPSGKIALQNADPDNWLGEFEGRALGKMS